MDTSDLESRLAGRWLHIVGLILVFLGTVFFLKVAFDHNWIHPEYRVALGLGVGAFTIGYAQLLARKGKRYFAEGITALGVAIEYVTLYSASSVLKVATPEMSLIGMVVVTACLAALAWRQKSERLALMAAIGGYATPLFVGSMNDNPWMLASYLTVLTSGMLLLAEILDSKIITPLVAAAGLIYGFTDFFQSAHLFPFQRAAIYAMLYAPFAVASWVSIKRHGSLDLMRTGVGIIAFTALLLGFASAFGWDNRQELGVALLALSIAHLAAAVVLRSRYNSYLATVAMTFAIPTGLDQNAIGVAWAAEAAVVALAGLRFRDNLLQCASLGVLATALCYDGAIYSVAQQTVPFLNERFAAASALFVAIYVMVYSLEHLATFEESDAIGSLLRGIAHLVALMALGMETWTAVHFLNLPEQLAQASLSVVMAIFASVLIASGLRKYDRIVRYEGLGLIIITAAKVFLIDLASLDISYRVISAVLVGVALIGVSYAYQRHIKAKEFAQ